MSVIYRPACVRIIYTPNIHKIYKNHLLVLLLILLMPYLHLQDDVSFSEILLNSPQDEGTNMNHNVFMFLCIFYGQKSAWKLVGATTAV